MSDEDKRILRRIRRQGIRYAVIAGDQGSRSLASIHYLRADAVMEGWRQTKANGTVYERELSHWRPLTESEVS